MTRPFSAVLLAALLFAAPSLAPAQGLDVLPLPGEAGYQPLDRLGGNSPLDVYEQPIWENVARALHNGDDNAYDLLFDYWHEFVGIGYGNVGSGPWDWLKKNHP